VIETALGGARYAIMGWGEALGVVVKLREEERSNTVPLRGSAPHAAESRQVPLTRWRRIGVKEGVMNISRENGSQHCRDRKAGVFIKGRDMGSWWRRSSGPSRDREAPRRATASPGGECRVSELCDESAPDDYSVSSC
jgi:Cu/Ag efflux pump CusA